MPRPQKVFVPRPTSQDKRWFAAIKSTMRKLADAIDRVGCYPDGVTCAEMHPGIITVLPQTNPYKEGLHQWRIHKKLEYGTGDATPKYNVAMGFNGDYMTADTVAGYFKRLDVSGTATDQRIAVSPPGWTASPVAAGTDFYAILTINISTDSGVITFSATDAGEYQTDTTAIITLGKVLGDGTIQQYRSDTISLRGDYDTVECDETAQVTAYNQVTADSTAKKIKQSVYLRNVALVAGKVTFVEAADTPASADILTVDTTEITMPGEVTYDATGVKFVQAMYKAKIDLVDDAGVKKLKIVRTDATPAEVDIISAVEYP